MRLGMSMFRHGRLGHDYFPLLSQTLIADNSSSWPLRSSGAADHRDQRSLNLPSRKDCKMSHTHSGSRLHRRHMLRASGAVMSLPLLEAMIPRRAVAAGTSASPKRLAVMTQDLGVIHDSFFPVGATTRLPRGSPPNDTPRQAHQPQIRRPLPGSSDRGTAPSRARRRSHVTLE